MPETLPAQAGLSTRRVKASGLDLACWALICGPDPGDETSGSTSTSQASPPGPLHGFSGSCGGMGVGRVVMVLPLHADLGVENMCSGHPADHDARSFTMSNANDRATEMTRKDKEKVLEAAVQNIEKQFGKGSLMRLGSGETLSDGVESIPTGSLSLDIAVGIGGLPRGRVIEIYGPESSGKTTLTLHAIAEAQKKGGIAAFIDAEHALDINYARRLGVKTDDLLISQPDTGEQALEIAEMLVRSGAIDILVIDSVAALVPKAEIDGEMGDSLPGLHARLMSQALRKLTGSISRSGCCVIFINQIRMKIGVMFGSPETTTGGNALKFYASMRLDIRRIGSIKNGEDVVGNRTRVKVVKNKLAAPFREVEFDIMYGEGINKLGEIVDLASELNIIEKSGAWYSYSGTRIGQGRDNARNYLKENPETALKIETEIRLRNTNAQAALNAPAVPRDAASSSVPAPAAAAAPAKDKKASRNAEA
jgi:recombination protein RecA